MITTRQLTPFVIPAQFPPRYLDEAFNDVGGTDDPNQLKAQLFAALCMLMDTLESGFEWAEADAADILAMSLFRLQQNRSFDILQAQRQEEERKADKAADQTLSMPDSYAQDVPILSATVGI